MVWRLTGLGLDSLKSQKRLRGVLKCHEIEVSWTTNQSTGPAILQNTKRKPVFLQDMKSLFQFLKDTKPSRYQQEIKRAFRIGSIFAQNCFLEECYRV